MIPIKLKKHFRNVILSVITGLAICFTITSSTPVKSSSDVAITAENFPDESFRLYVELFDSNKDGILSTSEAGNVTDLAIEYSDVKDVTGIKYFYNLQFFSCDYTKIEKLDLSNMQQLRSVNASNTSIVSLNVSNSPNLTHLYCSFSNLTTLTLTGATKIEVISVMENNLSSIDLSGLDELRQISVQTNNLTSLDLSSNKNLTHIVCSSNELTYLNVANLSKLTSLVCCFNNLTSLDLTGLSSLESLEVQYNQLSTIEVNHLKELSDLQIWGNNYTSLNIHGLDKLTRFQITNSPYLSDLTLYDLPNLTELNAYYNESLEYLDLSKLPNLTIANLYKNKLTSVKFANPNKIETLNINRNSFTRFDFTGLNNLKKFRCQSNRLTDLDLSCYDSLDEFWFENNTLLALNVPSTSNITLFYGDMSTQDPVVIKTTDNTIDLSVYPNLDVTRISNLVGATLDGHTLIIDQDLEDNLITYTYAINETNVLNPKIQVQRVIDLSSAVISALPTLTYTGSPLTPSDFTVTFNGNTLINGTDYTIRYGNNVNVGTATVIVEGIGDYVGSVSANFSIIAPTIVPTPTSTPVPTQQPSVSPTAQPDITESPSPAPTIVPTASPVTPSTTPTTAPATTKKKSISKVKVSSISNKTYTGKALKPSITVKYGSTKLKAGKNYTLTYKNNKKTGKASIIIKGIGNYSGTKTVTFKIVPKKVTSLKATSKKKKTATITWKKATGASGYQVVYSTKKKSGYKVVKTTSKTSVTINKLKSKRTYYIKIRAYKVISGKKVYGAYCSPKSIKIK